MPLLHKVRLTSAIVLVCAIVLPLSECTLVKKDAPAPVHQQKTIAQHLFPQDNADFAYQYAFKMMKPGTWQGGCAALAALGWPLVLFLLTRRRDRSRFVWILYVIELLLAAGTIYWLRLFTELGDWLYGAYLVCVAIIAYALTSIFLLVKRVRNRGVSSPPAL